MLCLLAVLDLTQIVSEPQAIGVEILPRLFTSVIAEDHLLMEAKDIDPQMLYTIPRNDIVPPEDLQRKVFPFIEEAKEKLEEAEAERNVQESSAHSFLKVLTELRRVFLQDLVCYRRHKIATYFVKGIPGITDNEMFSKFEKELNEHLTNIESTPVVRATQNQYSAQNMRYLMQSVNNIATRNVNSEAIALNNQGSLEFRGH